MTTLTQETIPQADRSHIAQLIGKLGPLIGLLFVVALFSALRPRAFVSADNFELIFRQTAVVGTAALGMTLIIIAGGIDLSVGSNIAICTVVIARLLLNAKVSPALAALGGIAMGSTIGLTIGTMVIGHVGRALAAIAGLLAFISLRQFDIAVALALLGAVLIAAGAVALNELVLRRISDRIELGAFIVTLGFWGSLRGAAKGLADNSMVYSPPSWLNGLLQPLNDVFVLALTPAAWMMMGLAVLVAAMLRYTRFGRHIFAIGSNEQTARLCGVAVDRTKLMIYALAGAFTGLAGVLQYSYLTMGDPTTAVGMELDIIAAVVIGGASLSGGQGSILGSLTGALIMTVVGVGCSKMGWPNYVQEIVTGGIIIIAVTLDRLRQRKTA